MMPEKRIERLTLYRRVLQACAASERDQVYSYELARLTGSSAAQVRRDLMGIGASGSCRSGYQVPDLLTHIESILDNPSGERVILVGAGHLGHALVAFFTAYRPSLKIVAALDRDPTLVGTSLHGCPIHPVTELEKIVARHKAAVAILAVPAAEAQGMAARLQKAGIRGFLNFAPVRLDLPLSVINEDVDIAMALEKLTFLVHQQDAPPAISTTQPIHPTGRLKKSALARTPA